MFKSKTVIATPPGATIREQLEVRGLSQKEFATRMGMSEKHISKLINGQVQLTPDVAERLEMVLGVPSRFWNKLEAIFREKLAKVTAENEIADDFAILNQLPFTEIANSGWLAKVKSPLEKVIELRKFFEVAKLTILADNAQLTKIACRRLSLTEKGNFALLAWVQRAKIEARSIQVKPINIKLLKSKLPEIRSLNTLDMDVFSSKLQKILAECGVALVFLPHIKGSFLHGATFYDGKKVVIGLTTRGKDADKFWFSLFHEIGHILLGHIDRKDGLTDEDEVEADEFAKEILIPSNIFNDFVNKKCFSKDAIQSFAKNNNVLTGIVVGRMQKEGFISFRRFNGLKVQYSFSFSNRKD